MKIDVEIKEMETKTKIPSPFKLTPLTHVLSGAAT